MNKINWKDIEKILNEAPMDATHYDDEGYLLCESFVWYFINGQSNSWQQMDEVALCNIHSLEDLRVQLDQHNRIKELESAIREVDCILGSLSND